MNSVLGVSVNQCVGLFRFVFQKLGQSRLGLGSRRLRCKRLVLLQLRGRTQRPQWYVGNRKASECIHSALMLFEVRGHSFTVRLIGATGVLVVHQRLGLLVEHGLSCSGLLFADLTAALFKHQVVCFFCFNEGCIQTALALVRRVRACRHQRLNALVADTVLGLLLGVTLDGSPEIFHPFTD